MLYQGSKDRIGKQIVEIIKMHRYSQFYEPFCGGLNLTRYMNGNKKCSDLNPYLIAMWKAILEEDWMGPKEWTREFHQSIKENKNNYDPKLVGWIGFCSFGGKFLDTFAGINCNTGQNYQLDYYNNIAKQKKWLFNIDLKCCSYQEIEPKPNSLIYCDPPYYGTGGYFVYFDHFKFWDWCREMSQEHTLLVSEYKAPPDFKTIWSSQRTSKMRVGTGTSHIEKLFIHESKFQGYFNQGKFV